MKPNPFFPRITSSLLALAIAAWVLPSIAQAQIEPSARALLGSASAKLGNARTIRLSAKHVLDPALGVGSALERGPIELTVKRPNQFFAIQTSRGETRELAYDGGSICVIYPEKKLHAIEPLKASSVEQFGDRMDERFGFRPPLSELLANDMAGQILLGVTSARVTGTERVGWTLCERLHFVQEGMTGDLWFGVKDKLPHRYLLTFTGVKGNPTWDIRLSKWELNVPVDESLFGKRPASDSRKLKMLKSRPSPSQQTR